MQKRKDVYYCCYLTEASWMKKNTVNDIEFLKIRWAREACHNTLELTKYKTCKQKLDRHA
jgi:hypothetical protein